ncbi:MAG: TetR/AcrR family transcriptional regulator [Actinobacteria bacterium]|nr:TetR/AcrR family transcriptional regulator [Actinomycetota bacterium]
MRADARRNRERLLDAAREAFGEQGPDASLDGIAQRAGVGSGTLYRHFPTREDLMSAVYRGEIEGLCARGRELASSVSPADALATWLRLLADMADRRGLAAALYERVSSDPPSPFFRAAKEMMETTASALLERAQEAGAIRPDVTVSDLLKLTHGIARLSDGPAETQRLLALVLAGLGPR